LVTINTELSMHGSTVKFTILSCDTVVANANERYKTWCSHGSNYV